MSKATRIKQAIRITVISTLVFYFGLIALLNLPANTASVRMLPVNLPVSPRPKSALAM